MAAYTSTQNGDWNNPATWGGGGYPSVAGDTASIGHTVTYNVNDAVTQLGTIAITSGGILKFNEAMNTALALGAFNITVASGGELRIGNEATPIGAAYTASITLSPASDGAKYIGVSAGGKLTIRGADVCGGTYWSYLAANWTSGQTLSVVGDLTAKWAVGQKILVHKFSATYTAGDSGEYTIASLTLNGGNTDILISEAAPAVTFRTPGIVINMSRNISIGDNGATRTLGSVNAARPNIYSQSVTAGDTSIKFAEFVGCFLFYVYKNLVMDGCVWRNGAPMGGGTTTFTEDATITNHVFYSAEGWYYARGGSITNFVNAHPQGASNGWAKNCSGTLFKNGHLFGSAVTGYGMAASKHILFDACNFYDNARNLCQEDQCVDIRLLNCNFNCSVFNTAVASQSTYDIVIAANSEFILDNPYFYGAAEPVITGWAPATYVEGGRILVRNLNGVADVIREITNYQKIESNTTTIRTGGSPYSLKITLGNPSYHENPPPILDLVESNVPAGWKTRSIYVKGEGWSANYPAADELYLEAIYLDEAGTLHRKQVKSSAVLTDNTTWVALSVTFYQARNGDVEYRLCFGKYVASTYVYADAMLVVEGES